MIPARRIPGLAPRVPQWCRAYSVTGFRRKPEAFHAQLESTPNASNILASLASAPTSDTPQTLTEKIVQRYVVGLPPGKKVKAGDYVTIEPHRVMTHDNSLPVINKVKACFGNRPVKIHNKDQIITTCDHDISNKSEKNLTKYKKIGEFAREHGLVHHPPGAGIGHQIMVEQGYAWPGTLTVASDSHSNHYGSIGAVGAAIVRTDAASLYATGKTWWQIPQIAKVTLTGILPPGVSGKDIIVALTGLMNQNEVLNHAVEFAGSEETWRSIPMADRMSLSSMTTEWGAVASSLPIDSVLIGWLRAKATTAAMFDPKDGPKSQFTHERIDKLIEENLKPDPNATYAKSLYINISTLSPVVSGPNSVKIATPVRDLEPKKIAIDRAYLVSCTNSRSEDIHLAANVVRDAAKDGVTPKFAPNVKFYMAAASQQEQKKAEEAGDWQVLLDAGAIAQESGCAQCIGLGPGLLEEGEVGISASNRNYKGRLGSPKAQAYLSAPSVVVASALNGYISGPSGPSWYQKPDGVEKVIIGEGTGDYVADKAMSVEDALDQIIAQAESMIGDAEKDADGATAEPTAAEETLTDILPGFPEKIEGEILFVDQDDLSTDGIYPGKYTYRDDMTPEQQAAVCMENYDPSFGQIAKAGDILVGAFNMGTGSSREQSATAILARNIPLVVSGSFGNIFSRNCINNALMGLEVAKLIKRLRERFSQNNGSEKVLTRRTGWRLLWDVRRSKVTVTEDDGKVWSEKVGELPPNVQEIIAVGGLENWVKAQIEKGDA